MHLNAAAARTPSGAPPIPKYISTPVSGLAVAIIPDTSPSGISIILAPTFLHFSMIFLCLGLFRTQTTMSLTSFFKAFAKFFILISGSSSISIIPFCKLPPTAILSI